jgi:glutamyl-tRNA synthetase
MKNKMNWNIFKIFTKKNKVVTRFAPSPTGLFHVGSARTALFSYLYAKQNGGNFLLRIEDTDEARGKPEWTQMIYDSMKWLNMDFIQSYTQSERKDVYKKYLEKLISENKAYISKEEVKEEGQRTEVIRFRNPNKKVKFTDLIRGDIEFDTTELGDFIIAKSLSEPIFHFTNVVDDMDSGITHAIRGEDHISNTPRHILIFEALGGKPPIYGHLPLMLSETREKLSKRKHGEIVSVSYYQKEGYLPEALINFLALCGWNPGTEQEILSMAELIEKFDIMKVQKSGAIFNKEKLLWMNKEYIKKLPEERLRKEIGDRLKVKYTYTDELLNKVIHIIAERISTFGELEKCVTEGEFDYFFQAPVPIKEMLIWKKDTDFEIPKKNLQIISEIIEKISETDFTIESLKTILMPKADELGKGSVLWPLRACLSGKDKSPDPFTLLSILGKEESLKRIQTAIKVL